MNGPEIVEAHGERLAYYMPASAWKSGLNFLTLEQDFIQVGTWSYDEGIQAQPHIHNEVRRQVLRTQEIIFVRSGKVAASIYDDNEKLIKRIELTAGDLLILFKGGHGYEILEDNTLVLEVKNGPYPGADVDRRRLQWKG